MLNVRNFTLMKIFIKKKGFNFMAIKYKWLSGLLREWIVQAARKGINKLPSEQELCQRYQVSRQTVRLALSVLENEGLIEKRKGSGSYITGLSADSAKNCIPVLLSDDSEYIYPGILDDIRSVFSQNGLTLQTYITANSVSKEREILKELLKTPPRGIIVEGCKSALPNPNLSCYRQLKKRGCTVLFLHNYYPSLEDCLYVKDDNAAGSTLLIDHLVNQGHTSIGGIFKSDDMQGIERFQGFMSELYRRDFYLPDERVAWYDSRDLDRLQRFQDTNFLKKIVQESLNSCTAVVCYNDMIAYFLIKELTLAGYHLPQEMAITAFDNTYLSRSGIFSITTLAHRAHEMGTTAAQMMLARLKGLPASSVEIPWILMPKESTLLR